MLVVIAMQLQPAARPKPVKQAATFKDVPSWLAAHHLQHLTHSFLVTGYDDLELIEHLDDHVATIQC